MAQPSLVRVDPHVDDSGHSFACDLKRLRRQLSAKQIAVSHGIGCTDAAVSLWESGARFPNGTNLSQLVAVLAESGASAGELLALRDTWESERNRRARRCRLRSRPALGAI